MFYRVISNSQMNRAKFLKFVCLTLFMSHHVTALNTANTSIHSPQLTSRFKKVVQSGDLPMIKKLLVKGD